MVLSLEAAGIGASTGPGDVSRNKVKHIVDACADHERVRYREAMPLGKLADPLV